MTSLLELKQYINNFVGKYEAYLKPVGKLVLSLIVFMTINGKMGYMQKLNNVAIVLIAALMCSFMPTGFIVFLAAVFIVLHMYALSLECAAVVLVLFLVLYLLYLRLAPKDTVSVAITPILTAMGIPYIMPVSLGLVGGPESAASVGCGIIAGRVLMTINKQADALLAMETDDMAERFRFVIDAVLGDKGMILLVIAAAITVFVTYFITKLPIDYSWPIAIAAGTIIDAVVVLIGTLAMKAGISIVGLLFGSVLAAVIGAIIVFFAYNLDYNRAEKLQFEDDDYMYYVRAVPKKSGRKKVRRVAAQGQRKRPE